MNIATILNAEFARRKKKNARYSLRSFAKFLAVDPTALIRIMQDDRQPSQKTLAKFLTALDLNQNFKVTDFQSASVVNKKKKALLQDAFDAKDFETVFASKHIYVLTALRLSNLTLAQVKNKLLKFHGIDDADFRNIIEDLKSVNAVSETSRGIEVLYQNKSTVPLPFTSEKRKSLQKEFLNQGAKAIDEVAFEDRVNATLTLSINKNDLHHVERILKEARIKINKLSEKQRDLNAVYNVCMAAYPIVMV